MMRSNSLPVLTQRELEALQDKDGELGIARGAHWAWVQDDALVPFISRLIEKANDQG
jgi:hypothetical protein